MSLAKPPVFDGHNDVLARLHIAGGIDAAKTFLSGRDGHIDILKAEKQRIQAEAHLKAENIEEQIQSLLCIEDQSTIGNKEEQQ